ncbi:hypothetical protein B0H21DRAFT_242801 [Amylocystis lapponica]|nr:hypothetical protein B0H21DRAFT_242801 [Amylocystis lapponica]
MITRHKKRQSTVLTPENNLSVSTSTQNIPNPSHTHTSPASSPTAASQPAATSASTPAATAASTETAQVPPRRYATRPSNSLHPAVDAGLQKQTQEQISTTAAAKKAKKTERTAAKVQAKQAKTRRESDGVRRLAELEDERKEQDDLEESYLAEHSATAYRPRGRQLTMDVDKGSLHSNSSRSPAGRVSQNSEEASSDAEEAQGPPRQRLTKAQKKAARKQELRGSVASARKNAQIPISAVKRKPADDVNLKPVSKKAKKSEGAFRSNWQDDWQIKANLGSTRIERTTTSRSTSTTFSSGPGIPSSPSTRASTPDSEVAVPRTPSATIAVQRRLVSSQQARDRDIEEIGGFRDKDVSASRAAALKRRKAERPLPQNLRIVDVSDGETIPSNRQRKPRTPVAPAKSLSRETLPGWIKPDFETKLLPTIIDTYGAEDNPWKLDGDNDDFLDVAQNALDLVCPRQHHTLAKSDKIYAIARQAMYTWRNSLQARAIHAVKEGIAAQPNLGSKKAIRKFVVSALQERGAALWGERALHSTYLLKTLSAHYRAIQGSAVADSKPPVGALTLCIAAVQRAFDMHSTGVFVAGDNFSEPNAGRLTREWLKSDTIKILKQKPHRFDALQTAAMKHIIPSKLSKTAGPSRLGASAVVDPPSSPVPGHSRAQSSVSESEPEFDWA